MDHESIKIDDEESKGTDHPQSDDQETKKKMKMKNFDLNEMPPEDDDDATAAPNSRNAMQMEMKEFDSSSSTAEDSRNGGQRLPPQFREFIEKQFKEKIIIDEETLVMEKRLFGGDVPECLTIPPNFLKIDLTKFLNYDENKILMKSKERKPGTRNTDDKDIPVIFIGPELKGMRFPLGCGRRILQNQTPQAVLISKECKDIAEENDLRAGEIVQLWAVRVAGALWFVLLTKRTIANQPKESTVARENN